MGIKEDFERDFEKNDKLHWSGMSGGEIEIARWAAKWAMERCLKTLDKAKVAAIIDQHEVSDEDAQRRGDDHNESMDIAIKEIRQLAKEME